MTLICPNLFRQRRPDDLRRRFYAFMLILCVGGLSGCASTIVGSPVTATTSQLAKYFVLQGRISVRVGEKIDSGKLRWTRGADEERLEIFTPFGSQIAEIIKPRDGHVTLRRGGESVVADSIDALTASALGVALDMDAIAAWTQGFGLVDGEVLEKRFGSGEIWQVTAERFQASDPYRFASRLTAVSGDRVVRLVIDDWRPQ